MLLNEPHFFEFENFVGICLLVDFVLLVSDLFLKTSYFLSEFELSNLLLECGFFYQSQLFLFLLFEFLNSLAHFSLKLLVRLSLYLVFFLEIFVNVSKGSFEIQNQFVLRLVLCARK